MGNQLFPPGRLTPRTATIQYYKIGTVERWYTNFGNSKRKIDGNYLKRGFQKDCGDLDQLAILQIYSSEKYQSMKEIQYEEINESKNLVNQQNSRILV